MWSFCRMDSVYILFWSDIFAGVEYFYDSAFSAKSVLGKHRPLLCCRVVGALWVVRDTFHFLLKELKRVHRRAMTALWTGQDFVDISEP